MALARKISPGLLLSMRLAIVFLASVLGVMPFAAEAADEPVVQAEVVLAMAGDSGEAAQEAVETPSTSSQPGQIPYKSNEFDLAGTVSETVLYLGILFTIAAIAVFLFKRRMVSGGGFPDKLGSHIKVVDRKALSTKITVHLLEVDGRRVMVSESPNGVSIIELGISQQQSQGSEKANSGQLS